ncbi:hypothetical protein CAOG_08150 [Capsaspora owczarzaki ATCC 30864]|uniref:Uncharacterized protein n=1 Tax=Capsaspora owczarzaki (strain ATCC 30864) TaxID=595528 RepID=A0A0D2UT58_CAPO3|nr:hypothetical protein CAOG_08150 [Capsaspora owczarzaki ATCC 30864]KJE98136.1 hypothetical protein CAOG_008150 [Capsaspora owczarzaki ATCC 30864]|eukprot:XP_004342751.1 hypothetical protein CAOG_08150 [Capsaspora owczarzaki ATCC 30864]
MERKSCLRTGVVFLVIAALLANLVVLMQQQKAEAQQHVIEDEAKPANLVAAEEQARLAAIAELEAAKIQLQDATAKRAELESAAIVAKNQVEDAQKALLAMQTELSAATQRANDAQKLLEQRNGELFTLQTSTSELERQAKAAALQTIESLQKELDAAKLESDSIRTQLDAAKLELEKQPTGGVATPVSQPETHPLAGYFQDMAAVARIFMSTPKPEQLAKDAPRVFIELAGHLRSQSKNLVNFASLVESFQRQGANVFLSEYTWTLIDDNQAKTWWKGDPAGYVEGQTARYGQPVDIIREQIEPELARLHVPYLIVVGQSGEERGDAPFNRLRSWIGAHRATNKLAKALNMSEPRPDDILIFTRPDILLDSSIDLSTLAPYFQRNPMTAFVLGHVPNQPGSKYDPSDVIWITTRRAQDALMHSVLYLNEENKGPGAYGGSGPMHPFQVMFFKCSPVTARYLPSSFRIFIHRLHDDMVALPHQSTPYTGAHPVNAPIDIVSSQQCKKPFFGYTRESLGPKDANHNEITSVLQMQRQSSPLTVEIATQKTTFRSPNLDDQTDQVLYCPYLDPAPGFTPGYEGVLAKGELVSPYIL